MMKGFLISALISTLFLTFASCSDDFFTHNGEIWGTTYHIVYRSGENLDADIDSVMRYVDDELSMFNPASAVTAVNSGSTDTVSTAFAEVFAIATRVNRLSGGVYDPTVGPLTELWGFGVADSDSIPAADAIKKALEAVGISECRIDGNHIIKKDSATVFDFSSVAKGYGIDLVCRMLESRGVRDYMVEIGGEVRTRGTNQHGRDWHIQIDMPEAGLGHSRLAIVSFGKEPKAMASSGNYRNFRTRPDGSVYGHTISPLTGYPAQSDVIGATVVADECALADALATACMASTGSEAALALIESCPGAEALIVAQKGDSAVVSATEGFRKYIAD